MSYIQFTVGLHGQVGEVETLRKYVEKVLRANFDLKNQSDLEIEIIEHTSGLICSDCNTNQKGE